MITLSDGATTITLFHLLWTNRSRNKALGSEQVTLGNTLVVERMVGSAGRKIILESRLEGNLLSGWFTWQQVEQLMLWRDNGSNLILTYDSDVRACMIPMDGIDIEPVFHRSKSIDQAATCAGILTLYEV